MGASSRRGMWWILFVIMGQKRGIVCPIRLGRSTLNCLEGAENGDFYRQYSVATKRFPYYRSSVII